MNRPRLRDEMAREDFHEGRRIVVVDEDVPARDDFVEDDAERIDVDAVVELHTLALARSAQDVPNLLGCHVSSRAHVGHVFGAHAVRAALGDAEVHEPHVALLFANGPDHDIFGLQIAVDDLLQMREARGLGDLAHHVQGVQIVETTVAVEQLAERLALQKIHDDERDRDPRRRRPRRARGSHRDLCHPGSTHVHDVTVLQLGVELALLFEASGKVLAIRGARREHLDRHNIVELLVDGLEHDPHAALPDLLEEAVFEEHVAGFQEFAHPRTVLMRVSVTRRIPGT